MVRRIDILPSDGDCRVCGRRQHSGGKCSDSVQLLPDGSRYVTTYGYGDVYVYTP